MEFFTTYNPMDRAYHGEAKPDMEPEQRIEEPVRPQIPIGELGASVTEGARFGSLIQTATGTLRGGAGTIELATIQGGSEPGGAESYGKEARQAFREIARVNQVEFSSVHTPVNVGNLSGFNMQQGSFSDEQRKMALDEVKKAIDFAGDAAQGGAVVVHTGEYQRRIAEAEWAKNPDGSYKFLGYAEEPGRAITYLVDDRTGKLIADVRKSQITREPIYKAAQEDQWGQDTKGNRMMVKKGDWIDQDGRFLDPSSPDDLFLRVPEWDGEKMQFKTHPMNWDDMEGRAKWYNERKAPEARAVTPEEMAFKVQMETRMLQARGSSLFYGRYYEGANKARDKLIKALDYYKEIENKIPKEEQWKIMREDPTVRGIETMFTKTQEKLPSEIIEEAIRQQDMELRHIRESSAAADAQAEETWDTIQHVKPIDEYAKDQSRASYAEAGIHAMRQSDPVVNPNIQKDIFVAPENLFPEMGYGTHPDELIGLVKDAREEMVKQLTEQRLPNPHGIRDKTTGELVMMDNHNYDPNIEVEQARKEAEAHIKATLDTQHLGMWRKHFVPKPNETRKDTEKRFKGWYMDQIGKLEKENIIGHIHLVDSLGGGHHHLPAGQGDLPLVDAITYLKKKGWTGTIVSEGHEENARFGMGRQMTETWKAFGSPVYSTARFGGLAPGPAWPQIYQGYFGQTQPPMFIYGAYSPSNEWSLWSQVPME